MWFNLVRIYLSSIGPNHYKYSKTIILSCRSQEPEITFFTLFNAVSMSKSSLKSISNKVIAFSVTCRNLDVKYFYKSQTRHGYFRWLLNQCWVTLEITSIVVFGMKIWRSHCLPAENDSVTIWRICKLWCSPSSVYKLIWYEYITHVSSTE